ncbi:hypothetical protein [Pseudonocardia sp. ICBG601]|uniref:hypothetical protein n=1 Tax=Pseudonocardia sp. ICBG601 TaxID=2846759 RepID=UPI001CF68E12|nr:hypothetical protein [Pseudonocardia sp. ICBG601]
MQAEGGLPWTDRLAGVNVTSQKQTLGDLTDADVIPGRLSLLVLYTEKLEACREFYTALGLRLVEEQHGAGPVHYSTTMPGGLVLEIYPGKPDRTTGRLRLGITVLAGFDQPTGRELRTDPDGRVIDLQVVPGGPLSERAVTVALTDDEVAKLDAARAKRGERPLDEVAAESHGRAERVGEEARRSGHLDHEPPLVDDADGATKMPE